MRIVITHTDFPIYWKPRLRAFAGSLRDQGHELIVVEVASKGTNYDFDQQSKDVGTEFEWQELFRGQSMRTLPSSRVADEVWQRLDLLDPDVVVGGPIAYPPGVTAVRWARSRRKPVVIMDTAREEDVPRPPWVNYLKRRVFRNVDAVLAPAPSHAQTYVNWGVPRERIFFGISVVWNEFFERRSKLLQGKCSELRATYQLPNKFFLNVARQIPVKNLQSLVAAYGNYRARAPGNAWDLVLVGEGPDRAELEAMVAARRIPGVHFRPFCDQETVCKYYAMASCFVLPSHRETWGLVINEAMASGLPVLASQTCGCVPSLMHPGQNGWVFPPTDLGAIESVLNLMSGLGEPQLREMGVRSHEIIKEWPLERFSGGLCDAIQACKMASHGFRAGVDRLFLTVWKGRYQPV